ncbi:Cyclic di-GMP phosphodiesterase [BD1-7 clade bacterium]|uniref:Cyclic di-GMP phosphodiesterase n=1 Tax=BD1-7 clade bacterium TaxID=2029982 RepID=A0A5S9R108_9GAMM|nr:Cyclic di-GMP phosphodiesterase [BD1-7 clade bacterium]
MEVVEHKIPIGDLKIGMYVSRLDRPWLETPFKIQGLMIKHHEEILQLEKYCDHVFVDVLKGRSPADAKNNYIGRKPAPPPKYAFTPMDVRHGTYREAVNFEEESKNANQVSDDVNKALTTITQQISRGSAFEEKPVRNVASNIVSSVIRNPDVMAWLTRVRLTDDYLHHHSIRCSVWAALLGRHIGLRRLDLELLTQAMLLKDIGKTRLPDEIISKDERSLNTEQRVIYRKHVAMSVQLIRQISGINPKIFPIIGAHRERYDGSGYPRQLKGDSIPLLAIIGGLATYYDELTNPRDIRTSISPSSAVNLLYEKRNTLFQEDIVVEFIQALGLYPAGSIVELNTGELAVVVEQYSERRLRPRIVVVTDKQKTPLANMKSVDLLEDALAPQEKQQLDKKSKRAKLPLVYIVRDLHQDEYPLDLLRVKEKLFIPNKKRFGFFSFK